MQLYLYNIVLIIDFKTLIFSYLSVITFIYY